MSNVCVIGSGISGATIANLLSKKYSVDLFDKARGPGGRASFKRLDQLKGFDHGTQYISPKTPAFKKFINELIKKTKILFTLNHGWKYSSNSSPLKIKSYWNSSLNLGVCADWFVGPRLEAGWISANDLYRKIKK